MNRTRTALFFSDWLKPLFLVLAAMVVFAGTLLAVNPGPQQFPLIGIGLGQTLRLNAVATPAGVGCVATLSFADQNGAPVGKNPGPIGVNLLPGQSAFADFPAQMALTGIGQRIKLQAVVSFPAAGGPTDCLFEAEIFDQVTGFSQVLVQPGPVNLPGANPSTFSLIGVAFGQVLRLNAVTVNPGPIGNPAGGLVSPGPCQVTLGFVDRNGVRVGVSPGPISINPGQGTFLDFPASLMVSMFGQRAEVRPVLLMVASSPGANLCMGVVAGAETFDKLSNRTWTEVAPGPQQ